MKLLIDSCNALSDSAMPTAGSSKRGGNTTFQAIGELMFLSHSGYQQCGLGSAGTDLLVMLSRQLMLEDDMEGRVFGAKITGGGSGGCVCIATSEDEHGRAAVSRIAAKYAKETQHQPMIVSGSSPGAERFGHIRLQFERGVSQH